MRRFVTILVLIIIHCSAFAQNPDKKWSIGIMGGLTQYNGDRGMEFYSTRQAAYGFGGISLSRYISRYFEFSAFYTNGEIGNLEPAQPWSVRGDNNRFRNKISTWNFNFQYNLLKPEMRIRPYVYLGAGVISYAKAYTNSKKRYEYALPNLGAGINIRLGEYVSLRIQENFMYTTADDLDFEVSDLNDSYLYHTIGLTFNLGKSHDADHDGISDAKDRCPHTPYGYAVSRHGCPEDKDNDDVPDYLDNCPSVAGLPNLHGCPDSDNDGYADKDDPCPDAAGPAPLKGCPDEDKDGIADADDKCPGTQSGYGVDRKGCPLDNDGDGVVNEEDRCPNLAGEPFLKGCPDIDGDSIADIDDFCPREKGSPANKGCAAISGEDAERINMISEKIYFEKNSAKLKPSSYLQLDALVQLMRKYNAVNLVIEGHTDDAENKDNSRELSQKRSDSVKQYLVEKGIYEGRISSLGLSNEKPGVDNRNELARSRNRRVELKTIY